MTPTLQEWAQQLLPVVQAAAAGKPIQVRQKSGWIRKTEPGFLITLDYRVEPITHVVNGLEVPAPEDIAPSKGTVYFFADPGKDALCKQFVWCDDGVDNYILHQGNLFLTKAAAVANAKAMCGIDPAAEE